MMEETRVTRLQRFKPWAGAPALIWMAVWIGLALSSVHQRMEPRTGQEEYGWGVVLGMASLVGFATLFGYWWGNAKRDE